MTTDRQAFETALAEYANDSHRCPDKLLALYDAKGARRLPEMTHTVRCDEPTCWCHLPMAVPSRDDLARALHDCFIAPPQQLPWDDLDADTVQFWRARAERVLGSLPGIATPCAECDTLRAELAKETETRRAFQRELTKAQTGVETLYIECDRLRAALGAVLDDLEDCYDGAPDSPTKWMSHHITQGRRLAPKGTTP